jgi:hypothetical protein
MAKGDSVVVRSEIGGQLTTDEVKVTGAGGSIEVDWGERSKGMVHILLKGRTDKVKVKHTFALIAVRSITETRKDDDA